MNLNNDSFKYLNYDSKYSSIEENEYIIKIANFFTKLEKYDDIKRKEKDFITSIEQSKNILSNISLKYLLLFESMLMENRPPNKRINIYNSTKKIENDSYTHREEINIYKTDTIFDVYYLLHEFTHYLTNRFASYSYKIDNNEICPILSEFIVSDYLNDYNFIKHRINNIIYASKSLVAKLEIIKGKTNIYDIYKKYNFDIDEVLNFMSDVSETKYMSFDTEISYIKGFIYALHYNNEEIINNYYNLVEMMSINRNIILPEIDVEEISYKLKKTI